MGRHVVKSTTASGRANYFRVPRWIGNDNAKGLSMVVDQAILSGATFASSVLVGRNCTAETFAAYYLCFSLIVFARTFQEQIISTPFSIRSNQIPEDEVYPYTGSVFIHHVLFLLLCTTILLIAGIVFWQLDSKTSLAQSFLVLPIVAAIFLSQAFARTIEIGRLRIANVLTLDSLGALVQVGLLGAFIAYGLGSMTFVLGPIALGGLASIICWSLFRTTRLKVEWDRVWSDFKENWILGRWAVMGMVIGSSTPFFMPWFVISCCGEAATAAYGTAVTLSGIARLFVTGFGNHLLPQASEDFGQAGIAKLLKTLRRAVWFFVLVMSSAVGLSIAFGEELIIQIYGPEYSGVGWTLTILMIAVAINSLGSTASIGLWAVRQPHINIISDIVMLGTTVGFAFWLVPAHEDLGAAIALLIGTVVASIIRGVSFLGLIRQPMLEDAVQA